MIITVHKMLFLFVVFCGHEIHKIQQIQNCHGPKPATVDYCSNQDK